MMILIHTKKITDAIFSRNIFRDFLKSSRNPLKSYKIGYKILPNRIKSERIWEDFGMILENLEKYCEKKIRVGGFFCME